MKHSKIQHFLLENYTNLGKIIQINKIKHNNINSQNYLIRTTKGNFVLREFSNQYTYENIKKICTILDYCSQKKLHVPKPIKRKNKTFVDARTKTYLTNFYNGIIYDGSSIQLHNLAQTTAHLHQILKKFPINYNLNSTRNYTLLSISELNKIKIILQKSTSLDKHDNLIDQNMDFLYPLISKNPFYEKLFKYKKQLIHNDIHPQNILFLKNSIPVILDFNSMRKGLPIEDVAFASFRFAIFNSSKIYDIKILMNSFVTNYQKINTLNETHLKNINCYAKIRILSLFSYILREKYFHHSDLWIHYLSKHLKSLKILEKIDSIQI